jgi:hypothetical protein
MTALLASMSLDQGILPALPALLASGLLHLLPLLSVPAWTAFLASGLLLLPACALTVLQVSGLLHLLPQLQALAHIAQLASTKPQQALPPAWGPSVQLEGMAPQATPKTRHLARTAQQASTSQLQAAVTALGVLLESSLPALAKQTALQPLASLGCSPLQMPLLRSTGAPTAQRTSTEITSCWLVLPLHVGMQKRNHQQGQHPPLGSARQVCVQSSSMWVVRVVWNAQ